MFSNLHTHTTRCRHAFGTEREYIEAAITQGIRVLGFSDHAPMLFPEGYYSKRVRMLPEEMDDYVSTLLALDFTQVLCSHQIDVFPRAKFVDFLNGLTDATLNAAKPVTIAGYEHINTHQADVAEGQILVFDWNKYKEA